MVQILLIEINADKLELDQLQPFPALENKNEFTEDSNAIKSRWLEGGNSMEQLNDKLEKDNREGDVVGKERLEQLAEKSMGDAEEDVNLIGQFELRQGERQEERKEELRLTAKRMDEYLTEEDQIPQTNPKSIRSAATTPDNAHESKPLVEDPECFQS